MFTAEATSCEISPRQVPSQHENDCGPFFVQHRWRVDRDPYAWDHSPLLVRVSVHREFQLVRSDPAVIQERRSLGRGTIPDQAFPVRHDFVDDSPQSVS